MNHENDEDVRLLRAWASKDRKAGRKFYDRYFDRIYRFYRSKVAGGAAHDLTQATMLEVLRSRERYKGEGSFRSFVMSIAYHVLWHHFRSCRRDRLEFNGDETSCADMGEGPLEILIDEEDKRLLITALRRIPLNYQVLLELKYFEGMTSAEVAVVVGSPRTTIHHRLERAKALLEREMSRLSRDTEQVERTKTGFATWGAEMRKLLTPVRSAGPPHTPLRATPRSRQSTSEPRSNPPAPASPSEALPPSTKTRADRTSTS